MLKTRVWRNSGFRENQLLSICSFSSWTVANWRPLAYTYLVNILHRFFNGFRSGLRVGQFITVTWFCIKHCIVQFGTWKEQLSFDISVRSSSVETLQREITVIRVFSGNLRNTDDLLKKQYRQYHYKETILISWVNPSLLSAEKC